MKKKINTKKIESKIKKFLQSEDAVREKGLKICREITRLSADSIKKIHQRDMNAAEKGINRGLLLLKEAKATLEKAPEIYYAGFLHHAEKELVEALTTFLLITEKKIPGPDENNFDYVSYLHGLCESIGELRRYILDEMRTGRTKEAEEILGIMDEIYFLMLNFQFPDGITRSLRRQVDYVRQMLERTRSEVTQAVISFRNI
jgi:translin